MKLLLYCIPTTPPLAVTGCSALQQLRLSSSTHLGHTASTALHCSSHNQPRRENSFTTKTQTNAPCTTGLRRPTPVPVALSFFLFSFIMWANVFMMKIFHCDDCSVFPFSYAFQWNSPTLSFTRFVEAANLFFFFCDGNEWMKIEKVRSRHARGEFTFTW